MELDFSAPQYVKLLQTLDEYGYAVVPVRDFLKGECYDGRKKVVILRHDIDRRINNALVCARIDSSLGVCSTFYFRYPALQSPDIIRDIDQLGHEVGYHYEVMSRAGGDPFRAYGIFEQDLASFRNISKIDTVCMHGAPLSRMNNLSFWDHYRLSDFHLEGEAFLSITGVEYFSDTGRTWSEQNKMRDFLPGGDVPADIPTIKGTDDLIRYITLKRPPKLYLVTHPERWAVTIPEWIGCYGKDRCMNIGKKVIIYFRG